MTGRLENGDALSLSGDSEASDSETDFEDVEELQDNGAPHGWRQAFNPQNTGFLSSPSSFRPEFEVTADSTPLQILKKFVTSEMIKEVCVESNRFVAQRKVDKPTAFSKWTDVTEDEMWRFLAINLAMGLIKKPSIKSYWSSNKTLSTPFFGEEMSRNRFETILSSLHLNDNSSVPPGCTNRFVKLGSFLKNLLERMRSAVLPGEYLCLDESMLGYKGRLSFKVYNPLKRSRFGILFYMLVDCKTGMILDILPYQGKATPLPVELVKELQRGGATVYVMVEPYFHQNHKLVADNFFNSPTLAQRLLDKKTFLLGTVQRRRKGMPKMTGKLRAGEVKVYCNGKILIERWKDRREVVMMNTFMPHNMTFSQAANPHNSRVKPDSVLLYNKKMGGVDSIDKTVKPFGLHRKTYKWYKKVFFHLIDMAAFNAWQAYKYCQGPGPHKFSSFADFILEIIENIMLEHPIQRSSKGRPSSNAVRKPEKTEYHIPVKKGRSDCVWCRKTEGKRAQTQIKCSVCNVRLCLQKGDKSCFREFHDNLQKPNHRLRNQGNARVPLAEVENSENSFRPLMASTPRLEANAMERMDQSSQSEISQSLLA